MFEGHLLYSSLTLRGAIRALRRKGLRGLGLPGIKLWNGGFCLPQGYHYMGLGLGKTSKVNRFHVFGLSSLPLLFSLRQQVYSMVFID